MSEHDEDYGSGPVSAVPEVERLRDAVRVMTLCRDGLGEELAICRAEVARLTAELARWKVCENCGGMLDGPGICSEAISEREKGLEAMHAETLTRAEMAEAELHEWRGYASFLAVHGLNPPAPASVSKEQP